MMFVIIIILVFATNWQRVSSKSHAANDLFEEFFSWRLKRSPEFATLLGIEGHDGKLGKEIIRNIFLKIFYVHF